MNGAGADRKDMSNIFCDIFSSNWLNVVIKSELFFCDDE